MTQMNVFIKQTHRHRKQTCGYRRGEGRDKLGVWAIFSVASSLFSTCEIYSGVSREGWNSRDCKEYHASILQQNEHPYLSIYNGNSSKEDMIYKGLGLNQSSLA